MAEETPEQPDVEPAPEPPVEEQTHGAQGDGDEERPDDEDEPNG